MKRWMAAGAACATVTLVAVGGRVGSVSAQVPTSQADRIKRGEYLVTTHACHDCHTPWKMGDNGPEPDMSRALSGHPAELKMPPAPAMPAPWAFAGSATNTAWAGPWGISYTQNLTPDETGLGNYTEEQFIMTLREGKKQGRGRAILPPMPWMMYGKMSDDDLKAIYAYLRSIKPIKNKVPEPVVPGGQP